MRFAPKSEIELLNLLPDGKYLAKVIAAEDTVSRNSGADMIKLTLCIQHPEFGEKEIFDYLLESFGHKLRHFCECAGLLDKYDAGTLTASDCMMQEVECSIYTDSKDPSYPPKNAVKDYSKTKSSTSGRAGIGAPKDAQMPDDFGDDTIPF